MKKISKLFISCLLALLLAVLTPLSAFAKAEENSGAKNDGKYISEVKIGMGEDEAKAAAALAGYAILSDENGPVDLNHGAGGGFGSKGDKVVYLGYKTTDDPDDAITDLAVMNMKGGYSVQEYEVLFESYIKTQIEPMIARFAAALAEYRVNFSSGNESCRGRAAYIHNALNKFTDDDTGKGLGDLLLNPTKYELGDKAYNALSDTMKKNTADIVTILCQANGEAVLTIENLIARAADASDDTWLDRMAATTYDDLVTETGKLPTDAEIELKKLYEDDAVKILGMWNDLRGFLEDYDGARETVDGFDVDAARQRVAELDEFINSYDESRNTELELLKAKTEQLELTTQLTKVMNAIKVVGVHDFLDDIGYGDGTMLDFFSRPADQVGLAELFPLVASLSEGQKAGLDFISMLELVSIAVTDGTFYSSEDLESVPTVSIYEGVDRTVYQQGGVALTNEALRNNALRQIEDDRALFSGLTIVSAVVTGAAFIAFAGSMAAVHHYSTSLYDLTDDIKDAYDKLSGADRELFEKFNDTEVVLSDDFFTNLYLDGPNIKIGVDENGFDIVMTPESFQKTVENYNNWKLEKAVAQQKNELCRNLRLGIGIAFALMTAISVYLAYNNLVDYYDVEYTPVPHYMVDEKDITAYNDSGEKVFVSNMTAYYKAVECNRTEDDEMYGSIGTCADLNGDVGRQWLALYYVKNDAMAPILADSLKAVAGSDELPANYTTGIHMFGSGSAQNLNDPKYDWESDAPSVFVYFRTDDTAKRSAAGSIFADGRIAAAGGIGVIIGALAAFAVMSLGKKKNKEEDAAA